MDTPTEKNLEQLIGIDTLALWNSLTERIDSLYDVDRTWNKGNIA